MKEVFKKIMAPALTMTVLCGGLPAVSGVSTSLITAVTANAEVYSGIEVAGVEITSENADDILGDGVFSYDPLQETITIAGDYTNKELEYDYYTGESLIRATVNCTVVIAEDSVVTIPNGTFIYSNADVTIEVPAALYSTVRVYMIIIPQEHFQLSMLILISEQDSVMGKAVVLSAVVPMYSLIRKRSVSSMQKTPGSLLTRTARNILLLAVSTHTHITAAGSQSRKNTAL